MLVCTKTRFKHHVFKRLKRGLNRKNAGCVIVGSSHDEPRPLNESRIENPITVPKKCFYAVSISRVPNAHVHPLMPTAPCTFRDKLGDSNSILVRTCLLALHRLNVPYLNLAISASRAANVCTSQGETASTEHAPSSICCLRRVEVPAAPSSLGTACA